MGDTRLLRTCCRCGAEFRTDAGRRVCAGCRVPKPKRRSGNCVYGARLTYRELQVAHLVSQAKPNKIIAYELHLTEGTIKEYLNGIYRKLGLENRVHLAVWVLRQSQIS